MRVDIDPTDASLFAASRTRPAAFDAVFERHFATIYRFAARQLGPAEGEDAAAETFSRAFAERARFRGTGSARAWLYGICVNVMREQRRRSLRRGVAHERSVERDVGFDEGADERIDAAGRRQALRRALADLRPIEREVMTLLSLGELSYGEIAEALGIPIGTVRSHVFRGRRALRSALTVVHEREGYRDV
jgi:RNA polymerase sigma factor (sigma-70 family)